MFPAAVAGILPSSKPSVQAATARPNPPQPSDSNHKLGTKHILSSPVCFKIL